MDWNHYNGPQMTPEQIHAYLDRIACPGPIPLTLAGLTRLLQAHQLAVPFENLDVLAGRPLSLDHEALFDKIVRRRQGGLCAELNTCFNWLLYSLGFSVFSYHARICNPPHHPLPPTPGAGGGAAGGVLHRGWGLHPGKCPLPPPVGSRLGPERRSLPVPLPPGPFLRLAPTAAAARRPLDRCVGLYPGAPKWTRTLPPSSSTSPTARTPT